MNKNSGNIPIHLNTVVENGASHRVNIQLCLILPFDKVVQSLQDSARTTPEQPHFLAHEITITIDGVLYPFHAQLDFKELIYADKKRHKVEVTMHCTTVATKPPKLSQRLFPPIPAYVPSTPQRSMSRGRSQSSMGASSSMKSATKPSRASVIETATTPAKRNQIAADLPAVPQSTSKPAPATCVITVGSFKAPQLEEVVEIESVVEEEAVVMPPPVPSVIEEESAKMAALPTAEPSSVEEEEPSVATEAQKTVEFVVAAPAVQVAAAQTPKVAKRALKKKKSARKHYKGQPTMRIVDENGNVVDYESAEGEDSDDDDKEEGSDEEEEAEEEEVEQEVPIAVPEGPSTPLVDPTETLFVAPEQVDAVTTSLAEEVEAEAVQEVQDQEEASVPSVDSGSAKTPEKTRSLSNPRGRASTTKSAAAANSARKNLNKRMTTCETPTSTLYNAPGARSNCVTQGEIANMLQNQLHRTTGSISTALAGASFNPNASLGSATKMPRSTPAKKAAPAKSANTSTATAGGMDLSPIRMTVSKTGRPSIGTIETQWEYMRSNFFNNDDEEIVWSMVSKKRGAYAHAHKKYNHAEDRYFRCIYDIATSEANIESLQSGAAARVVALLGELEKICQENTTVGSTADVSARYKAALDKLRTHIDANSNEETQESVMSCFSANTEMSILGMVNTEFAERDMSKNLRLARSIYNRLDKEKDSLAHVLAKAQKESEVALEYMEKWSRREKEANDYAETMREEETEWLATHECDNFTAFQEMRMFVPVNVCEMQVAEIMAFAKQLGGFLPLELATEIKQNKLLHWIVTHTEDIATDSFLTGEKKAIFENFESLDIVEMRAIVSVLPRKFENDKDGKKAEWRARFFARVRQLVSQQRGDLVKGSYDPKISQRAMVAQPGLKPEQARRSVYFFRTKEKSAIKLKQYTDRINLLARRENAVVAAKAAVAENKQEYDVLLQESRDASFIQTYGAEVLAEVKDAAKAEWQAAVNTLKCAENDLANLRKTIESMPLTYEQYKEQEAEMIEHLAARGIDWDVKGLNPQTVDGIFDESLPVEKKVKQGLKFVSAEEEAAQRKADLEALLSRKTESAMAMAAANASAEGEIGAEEGVDSARESANPSPTDFDGVPCTPGAENASESGPTAPNTEFKKLSTAALGIFSPTTARTQSEYSIHAVTAFETPRKRNSVLMNANPDMLNTLNKMLMNSPAATPLKNARQSLFNAASASKFTIKNSSAADEAEGKEAAPQVKAVTRSKLLMKRLTPSFGSNSGNLSPKRSAGMPKLNFLAQLTGRANGLKSTGDDAPSGAPVAPSAAPGGPGRGAMSFFADIARFRKPDADEVAVSSSGAAEESPKENGDKSNVEPSKALSAMLFKKAHSTSSVGGNPMAKPMMSMFDEIRKRRVIE